MQKKTSKRFCKTGPPHHAISIQRHPVLGFPGESWRRASTRLCTRDLPRLCTCNLPRLCTYDLVVNHIRVQDSCAMGHRLSHALVLKGRSTFSLQAMQAILEPRSGSGNEFIGLMSYMPILYMHCVNTCAKIYITLPPSPFFPMRPSPLPFLSQCDPHPSPFPLLVPYATHPLPLATRPLPHLFPMQPQCPPTLHLFPMRPAPPPPTPCSQCPPSPCPLCPPLPWFPMRPLPPPLVPYAPPPSLVPYAPHPPNPPHPPLFPMRPLPPTPLPLFSMRPLPHKCASE